MKTDVLEGLSNLIGLSKRTQISTGNHWQFLRAKEEHAFRDSPVYILYLDSQATLASFSEAQLHIRNQLEEGINVVVQNSAPVAKQLSSIRAVRGVTSACTVRELLLRNVARTVGSPEFESDPELDALFVEPDLQHPGASPTRAIGSLLAWITDDSASGPKIAVLRGDAGVGKTTVAIRLVNQLRKQAGRGVFPLLVQVEQWARLSDRPQLTLWDIWREALDTLYATTMNRSDFDTCIEHGLFVPILDGFDELCTRLGAHFSAPQILGELVDLVENTDGKVLLTSRDSFWQDNVSGDLIDQVLDFQLRPFNKQQTAKYLEKRFPRSSDHGRRELARRILDRLGSEAYGGHTMPQYRERLTSVPMIIALAAEAADAADAASSLIKYADLLGGSEPLDGLLIILFERERERRQLALAPEDQQRLFEEIALDLDAVFSGEDLELYASEHCGLPAESSQLQALRSHVLIQRKDEGYIFRFGFLRDYLSARRFTDLVVDNPNDRRIGPFLSQQATGGSAALERSVESLLRRRPSDWEDTLSRTWAAVRKGSPQTVGGFFHFVLKTVERANSASSRRDRTTTVLNVIGDPRARVLSSLYVEGSITGFDWGGVTWTSCQFNSAFVKCAFDSDSRFEECNFGRTFDVRSCDGFGRASFVECHFQPKARDIVQMNQPQESRMRVTSDQVRAAFRLALERFQRGVGFKSLDKVNCKRGPLAKSPICSDVWEALVKHGVLTEVHISGVSGGGLAIAAGKKGEVHNFLSNAVLVGSLREAISSLEAKLGIES
jgi:hypothetical protein